MKRTTFGLGSTQPGDLAQPDERDETPEAGPVDRKVLGPRLVIQQAASDIEHGLKDTDLHGTPSNVPGPTSKDTPVAAVPAQGGDRRSYAEDQKGHTGEEKK